ncbi:MAG: DEAD/DEAH box helicase [Ignavibacteriaceae bacterium]
MDKDISKELIVVVDNSDFNFDWQVFDGKLDPKQIFLQDKIYTLGKESKHKSLLELGFTDLSVPLSVSLGYVRTIAASFVKRVSKIPEIENLRENVFVDLEDEEINSLLTNIPYFTDWELIDSDWIKNIWILLHKTFQNEIKNCKGSVSDYFLSKSPDIKLVGRVFFHLVENKDGEEPFAFLATYSSGLTSMGKSKHLPLKNALIEYKNDEEKLLTLLSTVNKAAHKSSFITEMIDSGEIFHPLGISSKDAYVFLKEIPVYEEAGILCRIPNWWRRRSDKAKLSISVGNKAPSVVGTDALVDFNIMLALGGEQISMTEIKQLLSENEGLAFIKGKWIEVSHASLNEVLKAYQKAQELMNSGFVSVIEALQFQLNAAKSLKISDESIGVEVTNGEWLKSVIGKLTSPETIESVDAGADFRAKLRAYQEKGLNWLNYMKTLGLGACLADDMGLGKTIQVIALLNNIRGKKQEKALLIIPASLISNWSNEISRFAPSIKFCVIHPSENRASQQNSKKSNQDASLLTADYELYITTYGMVSKYEWLKTFEWNCIIIDEAQAIKNPDTKQTKEVKHLKAEYKIALTGTPIENRLSDLWSIFDFLNKGLLGNAKEFTKFAKQLQENTRGYLHLRKVVSPFILRRLKTDKSIITDLPDKIEMKTYASLSKKQAVLYDAFVKELVKKLDDSKGIERKGLILSSIMKFKQICNHPDQYLGQKVYADNESGKFASLREICETIYEKRERVLVFTQFREITEPLKDFLETVFLHKGLVLHGGTSVKNRKDIVAAFQSPDKYVPFLVLSIKAGGVGLNLTAANHVIHYDRWWNPAVENQATDRAFRIGQKKNVVVHKFITKGTIEEKIDIMIEQKSKLTNEIIPTAQENWITELDNNQLYELFKLSL